MACKLYVKDIIDYSCGFNLRRFISYSPQNLIGPPTVYPLSIDSPDVCVLQKFGSYWKTRESAIKNFSVKSDILKESHDFISLEFEKSIMIEAVEICEILNPGSVVRIWAGYCNYESAGRVYRPRNSHIRIRPCSWRLLWEGEPQSCRNSATLFRPIIRQFRKNFKFLRIEFNTFFCSYYATFDSVMIKGYNKFEDSEINDDIQIIQPEIESYDQQEVNDLLTLEKLPKELLLQIFHYLDLKSICRCAQVCKIFNELANSPSLYHELCFQPYWNKITDEVLNSFIRKCQFLNKLNLSWCGDVTNTKLTAKGCNNFLNNIPHENLTHLIFENCAFIDDTIIFTIKSLTNLKELRLRNSTLASYYQFIPLAALQKLETLDLTDTHINSKDLIAILKSNRSLKHLIVDFCEHISTDKIMDQLIETNLELRSFCCLRTCLSASGLSKLVNLKELRELDLSWTLRYGQQHSFKYIMSNCLNLRWLSLAGFCGITDSELQYLSKYGKHLIYLDLQSVCNLTYETCQSILRTNIHLKFLDISYCTKIKPLMVSNLRLEYSRVQIKCCEYRIPVEMIP